MIVLGIDPGTRKCGFAVLDGIGKPPLALGIEPTGMLVPQRPIDDFSDLLIAGRPAGRTAPRPCVRFRIVAGA